MAHPAPLLISLLFGALALAACDGRGGEPEPARQLPEPTPPAVDPSTPLQAPGDTIPSADDTLPRPPATPEADRPPA